MNTGWREINIHGCYSLVKIALAPMSTYTNSRRIWRHNASAPGSRDVTDLLWWRHNSEKDRPCWQCRNQRSYLFLAELCVQNMRNRIKHELLTILGSLAMGFANDFHEWLLRHSWKSLANRIMSDPKIVIYGNSCIILYFSCHGPVWNDIG